MSFATSSKGDTEEALLEIAAGLTKPGTEKDEGAIPDEASTYPDPESSRNRAEGTPGQRQGHEGGNFRANGEPSSGVPGAYPMLGGICERARRQAAGQLANQPEAGSPSTDLVLVEARPVQDEGYNDLVQATPSPPNDDGRAKQGRDPKSTVFLTILLVIPLFLLGITLLVLWGSGALDPNNDTTGTKKGASNPSPILPMANNSKENFPATPQDILRQFLPNDTLADLEDTASPQYLAFEWLVRDPALANYTQGRLIQRYALGTFYYAMDGRSWIQNKHWLSYVVHECRWYFAGVFAVFGRTKTAESPCQAVDGNDGNNNSSDHIYKLLWLQRNNVTGSLPKEVYWLTSLQSIDLAHNSITGTLDGSKVANLQQLKHLSVPVNKLTGTVPSQLGLLSNSLEILYLSRNHLAGTIPQELSRSTNLAQLTLQGNTLSGSLPPELGALTKLAILGIYEMPELTGTIPTQVGLLQSMRYIYAQANPWLTGTIPSEIGSLKYLAWLWLQDNPQLSGSIPSQLGLATDMKELRLSNNALSSTLPTQIGLFSTMYSFLADSNYLSGPIPTEFGRLTALRQFQLQHNGLSGILPVELQNLFSLEGFDLSGNALTGSLPNGYSQWSTLSVLNVSGNAGLKGSIPNGLCRLNSSFLGFDCSETLCGCFCSCSNSS